MLTKDRRQRGPRGSVSAAIVTAALLLVPSAVSAIDSTSPELDGAGDPAGITVEGPTLTQLQNQLDVLSELANTLEADNSNLSRAVTDVTRERDRLQESLIHFDDIYVPLEADRQLLFELRKGVPESRSEAEAQLDRMQRLALTSNPSRLGQLVDRVSESAPAYFEWRFTQFGSTQEASEAYVNSGANAFDSRMEDFRSAVLLSVANRLDGVLSIIDRVR